MPTAVLYELNPRQWDVSKKRSLRTTFIRQWRQKKGLSLDALAERIPMDKGNLSKVERGLLPYNQEMLEKLADELDTDVASLLMRDPSDPDGIWSIWDVAKPGIKLQIVEVAKTLLRTGTDG